jgi:hypothetical protein
MSKNELKTDLLNELDYAEFYYPDSCRYNKTNNNTSKSIYKYMPPIARTLIHYGPAVMFDNLRNTTSQ